VTNLLLHYVLEASPVAEAVNDVFQYLHLPLWGVGAQEHVPEGPLFLGSFVVGPTRAVETESSR
jgi:hypothetical protein